MTLFILVIVSGFCTVIAMCRAGIQIFWAEADRHFPHASVTEISAIVLLLGLCLLLPMVVQAPLDYLHDAARELHDAGTYVNGILPAHGSPPISVPGSRMRCRQTRREMSGEIQSQGDWVGG